MLNPALDLTQLSAEFAARGRLQVLGFFSDEAAEALHRCLDREVPWTLAYLDGGRGCTRSLDELRRTPPEEQAQLAARIQQQARDGYAFMYNSYMMITAYKEKRDPHLLLHRVVEFINSPPYLEFMRQLTGNGTIIKADAQATRYLPGHFLRKHNDFDGEHGREVAYVMNLTRDWQADWGGLLHFLDDEGQIVESFMPHFNSLSLFRVPAHHCVSYVSPFATAPRLAITGWLRSR